MRVLVRWLQIPALLSALVAAGSSGLAAQDICSAKDRQQACSLQCCGRKSCPPLCDVGCVKPCDDACGSSATAAEFQRNLASMQARCGYSSSRALKK